MLTGARKYEAALNEFLSIRGWNDKPECDPESGEISLGFRLGFGAGASGRGIIEINNEDGVAFFIYYDITCRPGKEKEMALLMNELNRRCAAGRFQLLVVESVGHVRWMHFVDFEGSAPTGVTIDRNFSMGWSAVERFVVPFSAVALTSQTAEDAIREFDEAEKQNENSVKATSEEAPSEL